MSTLDRWTVWYEDALTRWVLDAQPDAWTVERVEDWITTRRAYGPPDDGVPIFDDDDVFSAVVPRALVVATYRVVGGHERLIDVQDFDSPTVAL